MKRRDFRLKYEQAIRVKSGRSQSREERTVQALDLEGGRRELEPAHKQGKEEMIWEKGDLLDSLDLSSTKLKEKIGKIGQEGKEEKKKTEESKTWLQESIRESIKEWAPRGNLKENSAPSNPVPAKEKSPAPKRSKKVSDLRGHVQRQRHTEMLTNELRQIEEEERKMMESINRLDLALGSHQVTTEHVIDYTSKPRPKGSTKEVEEAMIRDSVAKLSEILERRSEAGTDVGSVVSAPYSACSAPIMAVTKIKSEK